MTLASSAARPAQRTLFVLALALCVMLVPAGFHASASGRVADAAAPVAVSYHLRVVFVDGAMQGRSMDAGVAGLLDSSGLLTATLTASSGMTSSVTGSLITNTLLTAQGKAGNLTLGGKALRRGGMYGGLIALTDGTPTGSWVMIPQMTVVTLQFAGTITSGRHKGQELGGTLTVTADKAGHFDGRLTLDDGSSVPLAGTLANGNLQLTLFLPGGGVVLGDAPRGRSLVNNVYYTSYKGQFAGPGTGDRGVWTAIQSNS